MLRCIFKAKYVCHLNEEEFLFSKGLENEEDFRGKKGFLCRGKRDYNFFLLRGRKPFL